MLTATQKIELSHAHSDYMTLNAELALMTQREAKSTLL